MSSIQVECWNCGLKFNVVIERLATARCGNCQQMIAKEEQPEAEVGFVNQTSSSTPSETQAIEIRPTEQRQEEKNIPATNEAGAESGQIPQIANSAHTITQKELLLGLGLSIAIALIFRVIRVYLDVEWLDNLPEEWKGKRKELFILSFNFSKPIMFMQFGRDVLTLSLFFFLSLRRRYTRPKVHSIAVLTFTVALIITEAFAYLVVLNAAFSMMGGFIYDARWDYFEYFVVFIVELVTMDFLTRRLFRLDAPASVLVAGDGQPKKKIQGKQVKMIITIPIIMVLGIPVPVVASLVISMGGTLLLSLFLHILGVKVGPDGQAAMITLLRVGSFLLIYFGIVWRAVEALKEGEGVLYAFYVSILEPLFEVLKGLASSGKK